MQVSMQTRRYFVGFFGLVFLGFFVAWEVLNFWTTEVGASMMMGLDPANPIWWVRLIAVGMVGLDIFHLAIFFFDRLIPGLVPDDANLYSWIAWGIVTLGDVFLSIYTFGYQFEVGVAAGTTRGPQVFQEFLKYAPLVVSFMVWGMTLFSIQIGRSFIASALGVKAPPRSQNPPRQSYVQPQPNNKHTPTPVKQQQTQGRGPHAQQPGDVKAFLDMLNKE